MCELKDTKTYEEELIYYEEEDAKALDSVKSLLNPARS